MGGVFPPRCRVYFGANPTTLGQELASVWGPGRFTRKAFSKVPKAFEQRPVRRSHCYECGAVVCVRADLWHSVLADVGPKCPEIWDDNPGMTTLG